MIKLNIDKESFIDRCNRAQSMASAAASMKLHFNTFTRYAKKFGCYKPNQAGVGIVKKHTPVYDLNEILAGDHPHFQTYKLKNRLLKAGILKNICDVCGLSDWNGKPLNMELDHIDGDRTNHKRKNLRMICPNCHAQTETYRSKNR